MIGWIAYRTVRRTTRVASKVGRVGVKAVGHKSAPKRVQSQPTQADRRRAMESAVHTVQMQLLSAEMDDLAAYINDNAETLAADPAKAHVAELQRLSLLTRADNLRKAANA